MLHEGKSWFTFDLPNKSGLASSSAYTVGLLRVCSELDKKTIAKVATTWEQDKMNGAVGSQDQYLCAIGGFHHLRFSEHGVRDTLISQDSVSLLQDWLMLFDTHQYRINGEIIPTQLKEMDKHKDLYERMSRMPEIGVDLINVQAWEGFGQLLDEAWRLKKEVAPKASTPLIDSLYHSAMESGAIGGKLCGGGGGGFIIFVVNPEKQANVRQALSDLTYVPFKFEIDGTQVIYKDVR